MSYVCNPRVASEFRFSSAGRQPTHSFLHRLTHPTGGRHGPIRRLRGCAPRSIRHVCSARTVPTGRILAYGPQETVSRNLDRRRGILMSETRANAMDHMIVVLFENRSLDNVLGHLYGPEDGKIFDGVIGKDLSNPIPDWAEHGAERKVVPYTVATDMDLPNPDSGEEYPHTNTQLFNIQNEHNRFKLGDDITAPFNAPEPGQTP